jgi:hypothetical protein
MIDRFFKWFRGTPPGPDGMRPTTVISPPSPPAPAPLGDFRVCRSLPVMTVPAEGDVFQFHVHPVVAWRGDNITYEQLRQMADSQEQWIVGELRHHVMEHSRRYGPHQALELERYLNDGFRRYEPKTYGVAVRWQAKVRVHPEDRVREKLRPYIERRIEMDNDQCLHLRRVELVDELTRRWSEALGELHGKPFTTQAAKLAEVEFAKIIGDLKAEEQGLFDGLKDLLEKAGRGHRELGLFEYAETYDKLIKEYRQRIDMLTESRPQPPDPAAGNGRPG